MLDKVRRTIEKYNMAKSGDSVLCCLSGGADSTALLLCLLELGFDVKACHANHNLRGEESKRDEMFCRRLCERLGVELRVESIDVKGYCEKHSLSVEQGAREMRYSLFYQSDCDKIATAHTLSDNLETAIFRLARGTGLEGLTGIPPVRGRIIRPLIECTRSDIEEFLAEKEQDFVTDSTNLSDDYSRNRIRLCVIPELLKLNPSLEKTYSGTLENLNEDLSLLGRLSDELYDRAKCREGFDCQTLLEADNALSGRVFKRMLSEQGADYSREVIVRLRDLCKTGGKISIKKGLYAVCQKGKLRFAAEGNRENVCRQIKVGEENTLFGKSVLLSVRDISDKSENVHKNITNFYADYGKIKGVIFLRNKRSGDKIKLIRRGFTSEVKKLLQERFLPEKRGEALMLEDDEGLFFVEGFGFAQRVEVDESTKTLLFCKISYDYHNNKVE